MRAYCAALLLAAAVGCRAQTDSAQANRLAVGLNFMTHGETCGGGLPRSGGNKPATMDPAGACHHPKQGRLGCQRQ